MDVYIHVHKNHPFWTIWEIIADISFFPPKYFSVFLKNKDVILNM